MDSPYKTLLDFVNADFGLSSSSKITIRSNIAKLKDYNGKLEDVDALSAFIESSVRQSNLHNLYGQLIKYFRSVDNEPAAEIFYKKRSDALTSHSKSPKTLDISKYELLDRLNSIPNSPYKLVVLLAVQFPALRLADYLKLRYGDATSNTKYNFIDAKYTSVTFNDFCKTSVCNRIVHEFDKEFSSIVKSCLVGVKKGYLFTDKEPITRKNINLIAKTIGLERFHDTRKVQYTNNRIREAIDTLQQVAHDQNHTVSSAIQSYI